MIGECLSNLNEEVAFWKALSSIVVTRLCRFESGIGPVIRFDAADTIPLFETRIMDEAKPCPGEVVPPGYGYQLRNKGHGRSSR
jgi:hypothetical protein